MITALFPCASREFPTARAERRRMTAPLRRFALRFALGLGLDAGLGLLGLLLHYRVAFGRPGLALGF